MEFRMPRSADHDLELVWKTGIDRPYDSMDNLPLGLLFEETADAEWSFMYPRIGEQCNCTTTAKPLPDLFASHHPPSPTFSNEPLLPLQMIPCLTIFWKLEARLATCVV
jgi:hypothetical protein